MPLMSRRRSPMPARPAMIHIKRDMLIRLGTPKKAPATGIAAGARWWKSESDQYSSRSFPPSAALAEAMKAPTSIASAVAIDPKAAALRAFSAACRA